MTSTTSSHLPFSRASLGAAHERSVLGRRQKMIAASVAHAISLSRFEGRSLLDVGCGNGEVSRHLREICSFLDRVEGVELMARPSASIPVTLFDGWHLPFEDNAFAFVLLSDVLHHITDNTQQVTLLRECSRVAAQLLVIKDHAAETRFDQWMLRAMDWIGNQAHGVQIPALYPSPRQWAEMLTAAGLIRVARLPAPLGLYPWPLSLCADRRPLQFVDAFSKFPRSL